MLLNLVINNYAFAERFYGIRGRGTGFLAFLSLAIIALVISKKRPSTGYFFYLVLSNVVVCGYFVVQSFNLDFFSVENFYSAPSSTLGNPNFVSGFAGFSVFAIINYFDRKRVSTVLVSLSFLLLNVFVLIKSQSIQGIIGLLVGIALLAFLNIVKSGKSFLNVGFFLTFIATFSTTLIGFFGRGPLASFLESSTVFSRLDYWRAAIRMTSDNWAFGVGLDGYGDFYRKYRDQVAINRFGSDQTADSAHNVFLDFFANGGIPLGIIFLTISIYPALKLLNRVLKSTQKDSFGILLLAIWAAYQLQATVSVNQLGVAIWGWILLGVMVSHCKGEEIAQKGSSNKNTSQPGLRVVGVSLLVIAVPLMAAPQLVSEVKFLSFANRADGLALDSLVSAWPQDSRRVNLIARGWADSGDPVRAKDLVLKGLAFNPNFYSNWRLLSELSSATPQDREKSLREMKRLDPLVEPTK
jgi:O-antigen ligase